MLKSAKGESWDDVRTNSYFPSLYAYWGREPWCWNNQTTFYLWSNSQMKSPWIMEKLLSGKKKPLRGPGDITQPPHSQIYFQKSKEIVTMQARLSDISVVHTGRMTSWWSPMEVRSRAKQEDKLRASRDPWCYLRILQGMRQGWGRPMARLTMLALPLFSFSSHFDLMARGRSLPEG